MNINCHHISRSQAIELHEAGFEVEAAPKSSPKNFLPIRLIGESVLHHDGELYRVFGNISAGFRKIISAAEARRLLELRDPHVYHSMKNVEVWKHFSGNHAESILNDPMRIFSTFAPFKPSEPKSNMKVVCKVVDRDEAFRFHNKGCVVEVTPREGREQWMSIRDIRDTGELVFDNPRRYRFRVYLPEPEPVKDESPQKEVDLLKAALVRCITIIQCSHGIATETEEWASSSDAMKKILAIDAVAGAKKALHGIPH